MSEIETRKPSQVTAQGFTKSKYLSDEQITGILDELVNGIPKQEAAQRNGTSWTQFKFRFEREPELAAQVEEAVAIGRPAFQELLRREHWWHAFERKDYKALRDLMMINLPDWEIMRTSRFEHTHSGTVEIEAKLAQYTDDQLRAILAAEKAKALDEHPVIELPEKSQAA
jgi:uncharacterized protein YejL (UPF0352 family)